ncbi:Macrofage activating glycoprotein [Mycena kentingensis (nom. inval.)]|nr:Macrofage activating glycoprotein [Mycena kentingensis (nom. inval.)]
MFTPLSSFARIAVLLSAAAVLRVQAQGTFPATPLASKHFAYPTGLPYQADTEPNLIRGGQTGYNICNSTTENQESLCQTGFVNTLDDFCLWGAPEPDSVVGDTEGESVAWCTKPGRGTRLIPAGALKGVQFMRTPDYVQVVGFIDQTQINLQHGDFGGEMDPHGADLRGNPLGGLVYSNAWKGNGETFDQVIEWHNFMGSDSFCFKVCDPAGPNAAKYCDHIYDRIGCQYNAPNAAQNGTFESCLGDNQDFPGIYTENGQVMTYHQPEGPIPDMPYTARIPASSSCTPFESASLFAALASVTPTNGPAASASASGSAGASGSRTSGGFTTRPTSSPSPSASGTGAAETHAVSVVATLLGTVFTALFLS